MRGPVGYHVSTYNLFQNYKLQKFLILLIVKPARLHFARTARALARRCLACRAQRGPLGVLPKAKRPRGRNVRQARPYGTLHERGDLSEFLAARTCASCWLDNIAQCPGGSSKSYLTCCPLVCFSDPSVSHSFSRTLKFTCTNQILMLSNIRY